jgi:hypothetical protein
MRPIVSRTSTERIVRSAILVLFVTGFAAAFLWDGHVRYARDNARKLAASLAVTEPEHLAINADLTSAEGRRLARELAADGRSETVTALLGEPQLRHGNRSYYLAPGGHLRVGVEGGRVTEAEWTDGPHTDTDLSLQRWIGYVLSVLGVFAIVQFLRVVRTRVVVSEAGLETPGTGVIPWDAVTAIRAAPSGAAGAIELACQVGGRVRVVKLDDYGVKDLAAVVAAICEQRGFTNPLPPPASP